MNQPALKKFALAASMAAVTVPERAGSPSSGESVRAYLDRRPQKMYL